MLFSKTIYKTISKNECTNLNKEKLEILHEYKDWMSKNVLRCKRLFIKGHSSKYVYNSFNENIKSVYKSKVMSIAGYEHKEWCKKTKNKPKLKCFFIFGNRHEDWISKKQIIDVKIKKDYQQYFQLCVEIMLPYEIKGHKTITLMAKVPKKFWKTSSDLYKDGFILKITKTGAFIHFISKKQIEQRQGYYIKAVYSSPYGGLYTSNIEDVRPRFFHEGVAKDYYETIGGISHESEQMLKLLKEIKNKHNKEVFVKNIEQVKLKCRTRANKLFKHSKDFGTLVFIEITNNSSKVTNIIQNEYKEKLKKLCEENGIEFIIEQFKQKELDTAATWCMRKADRLQKIESKKSVSHIYKPIAALKRFLANQGLKTNLGLVKKYNKHKESKRTFLESSSTLDMSLTVSDNSCPYSYEEDIFV